MSGRTNNQTDNTAYAEEAMVVVDGAFGEGGGQIVRTSVSLAAITGRAVEIVNIRAGRVKPGLQPQHLASVRAAAQVCGAALEGAAVGSSRLRFVPGLPMSEDHLTLDVGTAGAVGLVAQTLLVPLLQIGQSAMTATIRGGTHVPHAPPADYVEAVYARALQRLGANVSVDMPRAGFFPKGGGEINLTTAGRLTTPFQGVERGRLQALRVFLVTSQLPAHVAERGEAAILKALRGYGVPMDVERRDLPGLGPGAAIVVTATCETGLGGWTGLGERGKPIERVAEEAARGFAAWFASGAGVDAHLADQLVLPCALTPGLSQWTTPEATEHLRTVLAVTQRFLPIAYTLETRSDVLTLVSLHGATAKTEAAG